MRFIPTKVHGLLDYGVGVLLVFAPWLFGFAAGGLETWIPVILGLAAIAYSLGTVPYVESRPGRETRANVGRPGV